MLAVLGLWLLPRRWAGAAWVWAVTGSLATCLTALRFVALPLPSVERYEWIPAIGAEFHLELDGVGLLFATLTGVVFFLAILSSPGKGKSFYALLLFMESAAMGVFLTRDLLLFFICFEAVLIPMYFVIGVWGGAQRQKAAVQFVVYTALGSVGLLLGILTLYLSAGASTFEMATLQQAAPGVAQFAFWAMLLGFAIKVPMFPLHSWLGDAHTEAPTAGSVVLAAIMLKLGSYGIFRVLLPLSGAVDPAALKVLMGLSVVAILYGGFVSLAQRDAKRLIAYSSVSHLGFCTLGLFSLNATAVSGSLLQQINHGISTSLLFFLIGFLYERRGTRDLEEFGGLAKPMPRMAVVFGMAIMGSAGLPLLNGFVGEFTILRGTYLAGPYFAYAAVAGVIVAAAYLLVLFQKTMLGPLHLEENKKLPDLSAREWAIVLPLLAWSVWIGVSPGGHFRLIEGSLRP
jgi:NADH-quinone oxidoreductase subunit M